MNEIIYAIKVADLNYSGLKILDVKIGKTTNIKSTLAQYKRGSRSIKILNLWEANKSLLLSSCEQGVHKLADRYAYERDSEKFIFLQKSYDDFAENVSLLLKEITKEELRSAEIEPRAEVIPSERGRETSPYVRTGYTGKKPRSFIFNNSKYEVVSWTDLIVTLCEQIYRENEKDFERVLVNPSLKGEKRPYFSKNKHDLTECSKKIEGTDIYIETRFNANKIVDLCKKMLKLFGYKESNFKIETD